MVWTTMLLAGMTLGGFNDTEALATATTTSIRLFDLNDDGLLDRIELGTDGSIAIALNQGARQFEPVVQELPSILVSDVLVEDLNTDGMVDMYLVSPGPNLVLIGDNTGRFTESTASLGLADAGVGVRAEHVDIDADGNADVLLHNAGGDVIFWGTGTAFERDPATPVAAVASGVGVVVLPGRVEAPADETRSPAAGRTGGKRDGKQGGLAPASAPSNRVAVTVGNPPNAGTSTLVNPPPIIEPAIELPTCATTIRDASTGDCIWADSTPTLGRLYPLSTAFFVTVGGDVGLGTTTPVANLHIVGEPTLGSLLIGPQGNANNSSELILAEDDDGDFASFHLRYDGVNNLFLIQSDGGFINDRLSIQRDSGFVGIGTVGNPASRLHVVGDTLVEGRIRSDQTSFLWFSGMDLVVHYNSLATGALRHFAPGGNNYGEIYRLASAGSVLTMLPISGLPERIYGQPVTLTGITIYYKVDAGEYINYTNVYHETSLLVTDNTDYSSGALSSYTLNFSEPITGDMALLFETVHDAAGTSSCVSIPRVQVHLSY